MKRLIPFFAVMVMLTATAFAGAKDHGHILCRICKDVVAKEDFSYEHKKCNGCAGVGPAAVPVKIKPARVEPVEVKVKAKTESVKSTHPQIGDLVVDPATGRAYRYRGGPLIKTKDVKAKDTKVKAEVQPKYKEGQLVTDPKTGRKYRYRSPKK